MCSKNYKSNFSKQIKFFCKLLSMLFFIKTKRQILLAPLMALTLGLASCGGNQTTTTTPTEGNNTTPPPATGASVSLTGAGATFPAPLYQRWFSEYNKVNPNVQVSYQSVGSGAGVEQFSQGTVDFGASDVAMKDEEIAKVTKGVVLLPMTAGSVVFAYNLPGVTELKLSRKAYVDILLGKITKWNDAALTALNPGVSLPDQDITVVYRSDGSGTTGVFTKHLSAVSEEWKTKVGDGKSVEWPVGVGAKGNEGVTAQIMQTEGAIGYIEFGYAKQQNIAMATLENKAGSYIKPSPEAASKSLAAVTLPENLRAFLPDPEGADSYPIVSYTWILAYKKYDDPAKLKALKDVVTWSLNDGQKFAPELGYIPLPETVVDKVEAALATIQ
jgi:phosphate transport system substrate-binding protein